MATRSTKTQKFRIKPFWWPVLLILSPLILLILLIKWIKFVRGTRRVEKANRQRIDRAVGIDLPEVERLELTVIVDQYAKEGFLGDSGVSYLLRTERGTTLFDVGFGPMTSTFEVNTRKLNISSDDVEEIIISHLHTDHMGGNTAQRKKMVTVPESFLGGETKKCYVPDKAGSNQFDTQRVNKPTIMKSGVTSIGPLARMLFFFGYTEEQALVVNLKGKGVAVLTGCGHPTIEVILEMVKKMTNKPIYAIIGGMHFPITRSRSNVLGFDLQRIVGTGKPAWRSVNDGDLTQTIDSISRAKPKALLLSGHDTCDYSLERMRDEINVERCEILKAGEVYTL